MVDLVHSGTSLTLERIACSCSPSAPEGLQICDDGRRCETLHAGTQDLGAILLQARLAKSYSYRWDRVPPKPE